MLFARTAAFVLAGLLAAVWVGPTQAAEEAEELEVLIAAAKDKQDKNRVEACRKIARYGPKAKKAIAVLLGCVKEEAMGLRKAAKEVVDRRQVPGLKGVKDPEAALGIAAADALGAIGPLAKKETAVALRELLLYKPTDKVGFEAEELAEKVGLRLKGALARALGRIDPDGKETIKLLSEDLGAVFKKAARNGVLHDRETAEFAIGICEGLGHARPGGDAAVDVLYQIAQTDFWTGVRIADPDQKRAHKLAAMKALKAIGTAGARNRLGRLVQFSKDEVVKEKAREYLDALKKSGPAAKKP
jgi:hypothetical protein